MGHLNSMNFVECDFCHNEYIKGKGHMCWCDECSKPHPMCDKCYQEAKKEGIIVDKDIPMNSINNKNKERYT